MAMDDGCGWTSREMNAGALACQNLDPLTTGMISCYFSSSGVATTGSGTRGRARGNIYPRVREEQFSQNNQWPGRPAPALAMAIHLTV